MGDHTQLGTAYPNPFAVDEDRALAELELAWSLGDLMDHLDAIYPSSSEEITR